MNAKEEKSHVEALEALAEDYNSSVWNQAWTINYKSFAEALCSHCKAGKEVVYFGDASGYQGYMHKMDAGVLEVCRAQACQDKIHKATSLQQTSRS